MSMSSRALASAFAATPEAARRRYELRLTGAQTWAELARVADDGAPGTAYEGWSIRMRSLGKSRFELAWHDDQVLALVQGRVEERDGATTVSLAVRDGLFVSLSDRSWTALGAAGLAFMVVGALTNWLGGAALFAELMPLVYFAVPLSLAAAFGRARRRKAAAALLQAIYRRLEPHRCLPGHDPFRRELAVADEVDPVLDVSRSRRSF